MGTRGGLGPGEKAAKAEKMNEVQAKPSQLRRGSGQGKAGKEVRHRIKSLKQVRTAASTSGAFKIYSLLLKEKDHSSYSCAGLGCKHDV